MESLVDYYRKYETTVPDFSAVVRLGDGEVAREQFRGAHRRRAAKDMPMARVLARRRAGRVAPLTFTREGTGTLFYTARLRYAADALFQQGLDTGFSVERTYAPYVETGPGRRRRRSRPAISSGSR